MCRNFPIVQRAELGSYSEESAENLILCGLPYLPRKAGKDSVIIPSMRDVQESDTFSRIFVSGERESD